MKIRQIDNLFNFLFFQFVICFRDIIVYVWRFEEGKK